MNVSSFEDDEPIQHLSKIVDRVSPPTLRHPARQPAPPSRPVQRWLITRLRVSPLVAAATMSTLTVALVLAGVFVSGRGQPKNTPTGRSPIAIATATATNTPGISPSPVSIVPTGIGSPTPPAPAKSTQNHAPSAAQINCLQLQGDGVHPIYTDLDNCGFPSPDTTGVPSGTALRTVSSSCGCLPQNTVWNGSQLAVTGPTTINGLYIPGHIYFVTSDFSDPSNADVTIENSKVQTSSVSTMVDLQGAGHVTIKSSQISGGYTGATCTGPASYDVSNGGANNVLDHDNFSCAAEVISGNFTLTNSYVIMDARSAGEDVYIPPGGGGDIEGDTLLNSYGQTAGVFGDAKLGALNGLTVSGNLIAEGGSNGDIAVGCYGGGVPNDGYGYDKNVVIERNRISAAYNTGQSPFLAGNTDGGSGTLWSENYMDNGPSQGIGQPVSAC
jgi:hypothetical protein